MAEAVTVARPYADAVYKLAIAKNAVGEWSEMLRDATDIAANENVKALIDNPLVTAQQLCELLLKNKKKQFNSSFYYFIFIFL